MVRRVSMTVDSGLERGIRARRPRCSQGKDAAGVLHGYGKGLGLWCNMADRSVNAKSGPSFQILHCLS